MTDHGHHHDAHAHVHGVVDPSIASTARGLQALTWSFAGLMVTALLQAVVVVLSGSVALLADTIHNFADAATAIPLGVAFWLARRGARDRKSVV
jgi:divalent metal cation (Fe/Co/Zn/Cd) transporter